MPRFASWPSLPDVHAAAGRARRPRVPTPPGGDVNDRHEPPAVPRAVVERGRAVRRAVPQHDRRAAPVLDLAARRRVPPVPPVAPWAGSGAWRKAFSI